MSVRDHVSTGQVSWPHDVQFFDSDDTRQDAVAAFLADAYRSGSALIVIARPLNSEGIVARLEQRGIPMASEIASGRITVLDAQDTLKRISRTGSPAVAPFDEIVGGLVRRVSRHGRVCAYGEMVDLLAQRGDFFDVARLEDLWNRLASRMELSLLCGYSAAHFVTPGTTEALHAICGAHASIRVQADDPLASWLLQQAQ